MAATKQTAKQTTTAADKAEPKRIAKAPNRAKPGQKNQPAKRDNSKGKNTKAGNQPGEARELENVTGLEEIAEPKTTGASKQGATESTTENATRETAEAQTTTEAGETVTNQATETAQQTAQRQAQPAGEQPTEQETEQTQPPTEQPTADSSQQAEHQDSQHQPGQPHHQIAQIARTGAAVTMQEGEERKAGSISDLVHPKKKAMLLAIEKTSGSILVAAQACKMSTASHYQWMKEDPLYAELFQEYYNRSTQTLITEAIRRATEGQQEPILYQGKQVIGENGKPLYKTFKSDNLIMFLLKQRDPTFRDNYIHNVGIWGKSGQVNLVFNIPRPAGEVMIPGSNATGKKHHSDNIPYVNKSEGDIIDVEPEPEQGDQCQRGAKG